MANKEMDKLSQDAAKAKASGLSYGRWKALQPVPVKKKEVKIPECMKACPYCGKLFTPHNGKHKFCEPYCRLEANYEKHREQKTKWERKKREEKRKERENEGNA